MPDYVFADAKIGASTWKTVPGNETRPPACCDPVLMRTEAYHGTAQTAAPWAVVDNVFTVLFTGININSHVFFGLSNRVRSIGIKIEELEYSYSAKLANNNLKLFIGRNIIPLDPMTASAYPQRPRVHLVNANNPFGAPIYLESVKNIAADTTVAYGAGGFNDNIYGCGFSLHMEARVTGTAGLPHTAHWRVTLTPSATPI